MYEDYLLCSDVISSGSKTSLLTASLSSLKNKGQRLFYNQANILTLDMTSPSLEGQVQRPPCYQASSPELPLLDSIQTELPLK